MTVCFGISFFYWLTALLYTTIDCWLLWTGRWGLEPINNYFRLGSSFQQGHHYVAVITVLEGSFVAVFLFSNWHFTLPVFWNLHGFTPSHKHVTHSLSWTSCSQTCSNQCTFLAKSVLQTSGFAKFCACFGCINTFMSPCRVDLANEY